MKLSLTVILYILFNIISSSCVKAENFLIVEAKIYEPIKIRETSDLVFEKEKIKIQNSPSIVTELNEIASIQVDGNNTNFKLEVKSDIKGKEVNINFLLENQNGKSVSQINSARIGEHYTLTASVDSQFVVIEFYSKLVSAEELR